MNLHRYIKRQREEEDERRRRLEAERIEEQMRAWETTPRLYRFSRPVACSARKRKTMHAGGRLSITINLDAIDVQASASFYIDVLGFTALYEISPTSGWLKREGLEIGLQVPADLMTKKPRDPEIQMLWLNFTDIRGIFKHIQQFAGRYEVGGFNQGFMRPSKHDGSFKIKDPTGHLILLNASENAENLPGDPWVDPMNRDELVPLRKLAGAIGCKPRFVVAMLRAGYLPQYPALGKTTARHALAALERVPAFRAQSYLQPGWKSLPKVLPQSIKAARRSAK